MAIEYNHFLKVNSQSESCHQMNAELNKNNQGTDWSHTVKTTDNMRPHITAQQHPKDKYLHDEKEPLEHGVNDGSQKLS